MPSPKNVTILNQGLLQRTNAVSSRHRRLDQLLHLPPPNTRTHAHPMEGNFSVWSSCQEQLEIIQRSPATFCLRGRIKLHEASGRQATVIAGGAGEGMVGCWKRGDDSAHPVTAALRHDSITTNMNPRWPPGAVSAARIPPLSSTSPLVGEW
ncbi:uncharacterized protein LOC110828808 isoform X2 [Zootermopsis nevadensis]|uniref:uncharacterized protein LOC110828808 isoform X2 n=1 Tax=Zootermopsis nevadensis TaxID=136037 RepID=UPI000B8E5067|nr:uncharacterized protein LOC110828808 isoform X2 [Zootermopsis nevadensis]